MSLNNMQKKATAIRFDFINYEYIDKASKANNRSMSGEVNWMCRVVSKLREHYKETYSKIVEELEDRKE